MSCDLHVTFNTEDRLIMKQVQMVEITAFVEIAPQYFQHVSEAVKNEVCVCVYLSVNLYLGIHDVCL